MANNIRHQMHCSHPDRNDDKKSHPHSIATVWLPPEIADLMKEKNLHIGIQPHNNPAASWVIFAPRDWDNEDDPGDGKGGRW
jgi:hypothetical protein